MGYLAILAAVKPIVIALAIPCAGFLYHYVTASTPAIVVTTAIVSINNELHHPVTLCFVTPVGSETQDIGTLQIDTLIKQPGLCREVHEAPPGLCAQIRTRGAAKKVVLIVSDGAVREKFVLVAGKRYRVSVDRSSVLVKKVK